MPDESIPADERFLELMNRLRRLGPGSPPFADTPLSPAQLALLNWVATTPGCSIQEMAAGLGLTPPTVSVGARRLETAGLLERQPDPRDGRSVQLFLTSQGETLQQKVQSFRRQKIQRLLAGLTPQEQETLLNLLERAISTAEIE